MALLPMSKRLKLSPSPASSDGSSQTTLFKSSVNKKLASKWNLEQDYELRPRKSKKKEKESTRLPIKTRDGQVQQAPATHIPEDSGSDMGDMADMEWLGIHEPAEVVKKEHKVSLKKQIAEAKETLAKTALMLRENDPEEHVGAFKTLAQVGQSSNVIIRKLALITQLAVYKDIIPSYRIRPLSEEDMEVKVGKEVKKLRAYEQALVGAYQKYIRELSKLASSGKSHPSNDDDSNLCNVAISCACALLVAVPHFNFRGELLKILVEKLSCRKIDADFIKCRETLETLFRDDEDGTASLDAVSHLTKMMKGKGYHVDESVLNIFLHLRLLSEFSWKGSTNHVDKPSKAGFNGKKLKEKRTFRTKKERKLMKERKEVEKQMEQADATVSHEHRDKMQAETLKLVFVTYFRILKLRIPSLTGAVLEGLAKYAHLINQDFFGDLLEALKDLIRHADSYFHSEDGDEDEEDEEAEGRNPSLTREALLCIITAFALLEGQDAAKAQSSLSLDLSFFTAHLYRTLHALSMNPDIELSAKSLHLSDRSAKVSPCATTNNKINIETTTVLLLRSISCILTPKVAARAVPSLRIAAFTKQLLTSSLQLPENSCIALISFMGKVTKLHGKKIASLWNTEERRGDGTFDALCSEIEGSNAFAATIWEGELLRKHFSPAIRDGVKSMEKTVLGLT
ncbi:hypothetical protein K3495_g2605 [Podosphaera aphanis]|nr:hypothetical protein K3495_g2605 [Podosphaera aphanis]